MKPTQSGEKGVGKRLPLKKGEKLAFNIEEPDFGTTTSGKPELNKPFTGQAELGKHVSELERQSADTVRR
jgi:hypothetical protein